jgi:hypothetical protein
MCSCNPPAFTSNNLANSLTPAVIGPMIHVPDGGPLSGGSVQGAHRDAFPRA